MNYSAQKLKTAIFTLALMALGYTALAQAPDLSGQKLTVSRFDLEISDDVVYAGRDMQNFEQDFNLAFQGQDWLTRAIYDPVYEQVMQAINEEVGTQALPASALRGKVFYNLYNYPMGRVKRVAKQMNGNDEYIAHVRVRIAGGKATVGGTDFGSQGMVTTGLSFIRPKVIICVKLANSDGKVVYKTRSRARSPYALRTTDTAVMGVTVNSVGVEAPETEMLLMQLVEQAVDGLFVD